MIDNAFIALLTHLSMKFLLEYDALSAVFDYYDRIIPQPDHTQYKDAYNAFKHYGRTLLLHLQKKITIPVSLAPEMAIK